MCNSPFVNSILAILVLLFSHICYAQNWMEHYNPDDAVPFTIGKYLKGLLILAIVWYLIKAIFGDSSDD